MVGPSEVAGGLETQSRGIKAEGPQLLVERFKWGGGSHFSCGLLNGHNFWSVSDDAVEVVVVVGGVLKISLVLVLAAFNQKVDGLVMSGRWCFEP